MSGLRLLVLICRLSIDSRGSENSYTYIGEIVVPIVLFVFCLYVLIPEIRHQLRVFRSQSWSVTSGTVQKGQVLHSGPAKYLQLPFRSLLGYAYKVNGKPYCGLFVLPTEDMEAAEKLQKQCEGKQVSVKYDPESPEISLLADRQLLGRRIIQKPPWLD